MADNSLVVLNNQQQALTVGGVGMGAAIFRAKPFMVEMVQTTTRQEGAQPGQFRVISTNEHLGPAIRVVLLTVPTVQREWFDGAEFSKDSKQCFSLDNVRPHARAKNPPAMFCRVCPKGDINWEIWRKDPRKPAEKSALLPPCSAYYHILVADRASQTPYYLNIKGKSFLPFKQAMEQQMQGLLAKLFANVKAENKKRGYTCITDRDEQQRVIGYHFDPTPGFEGERLVALPLPNIFDVSFDIVIERKAGNPYQMAFKNFKHMSAEDRAEFGQLYLDILQQKAEIAQQYEEQAAVEAQAQAEAQVDAAVTEPEGEVLPPIQI